MFAATANREPSAVRILLVEDDPTFAVLIEDCLLLEDWFSSTLTHTNNLASGLERLVEGGIDVVLLDLGLPDSGGKETLTRMHECVSDIPIVVLTGMDDRALAEEVMRAGAQDYLIKGQTDSRMLVRSLRYAIERQRVTGELETYRRHLEVLVRERTAELECETAETEAGRRDWEESFDAISDMITIHDAEFNILRANQAACDILGIPRAEIVGHKCYEVYHGSDGPPERCPSCATALTGECVGCVFDEPHLNRWLDIKAFPRHDSDGAVTGIVHVATDVTERKKAEQERGMLEQQLRQAQKLESIGTLASGVAHEINNPINGILNYAQLIKDGVQEGDPNAEFAAEIMHETARVATIVRNLLTFSRTDEQEHSPALVSDIIEVTLSLIRTVIRRDQIDLCVDVPENLPKIKCRSQQIQQVIMNLLTNARDALNEKYEGYHEDKLIRISARELPLEKVAADSGSAGGCVPCANRDTMIRITVEDHGTGIPDEVRERMLDPFFTTKDRAHGTGLGLSISHGIVTDHHGQLTVETEVGRYTRFHVDLPVDQGWELE